MLEVDVELLEGQGEVALAMGCFVMDCVLYKKSLSEAHRKTMQEAMKASYMGGGPPKKDKIPFSQIDLCRTFLPGEEPVPKNQKVGGTMMSRGSKGKSQ